MNQSKFLNRMFRKVNGVVWDLASNSMGLQNTNGIYTLNQRTVERENQPAETVFTVNVNPFDAFGLPVPAFAQLTKLEDVSVGDIVVGDKGALGWVTKKHARSLELMDQNGMTKNYTPPKVSVMDMDGALVVKSLTGLFGQQGGAGFSNALLPLVLAGGNNLDDLLPLLLLTQQQAGDNPNALAQALPTILMVKTLSDKSGNARLNDLLLPMILSGNFGGNAGGFNPMLLLALNGEGFGNVQSQFIAGGAPALQARQLTPPPLTIRQRS